MAQLKVFSKKCITRFFNLSFQFSFYDNSEMPRKFDAIAYTQNAPLFGLFGLLANIIIGCIIVLAFPGNFLFFPLFLLLQAVLVFSLIWPHLATAVVLLIIALTPDGWAGSIFGIQLDLVGFQKVLIILLSLLLILRHGLNPDLSNPVFPYTGIFCIGIARGLGLGMTIGESLRSLIGGCSPFLLAFVRMPPRLYNTIIWMIILMPVINLVGGILLEGLGLRSLLDQSGRLQALKSAPQLAHFCLWSLAASILEFLRSGRARYACITAVTAAILLATGARAPSAYAIAFSCAALLFTHTRHFGTKEKSRLILGMLAGVVCMLIVMLSAGSFRALDLDSVNQVSGRDLMWPLFVDAIEQSPWFGYGVGAGKFVVDISDSVARLLGTTAAHNEYLRLSVEGGLLGSTLMVGTIILWCALLSRRMLRHEKILFRVAFLLFALLSITDNTLIATTALSFFSWVAAFSARSFHETEHQRTELRRQNA